MWMVLKILGVLVLVLAIAAGVGLWWTTLPMRFAGIDRDPSLVAIVPGELPALEQPGITRRQIVELLHARDFDTLTRVVESRHARALADPREEVELERVIAAFDIGDQSFSPDFEAWVIAKPSTFAPLLAAARHRFSLSFEARGTQLGKDTTEQQFEGMTKQLQLAVEDIAAALRIEPRLSEAYALLIDVARSGGTQRDCGRLAKKGLELMPTSFRIRNALAICRLPRWGGSYERVEAVAKAADPFFADNARLAALHGFVEWDRGRLAKGDEAIGHYTTALTYGDHATFYQDRARVHNVANRFREALEDVDAALRLRPDSPDVLVQRLYALYGLNREAEIPDIVALVETIDPTNSDLARFKTAYAAAAATALGFEAYRNQDAVLAQRGEWPAIINLWTEYLSRKPDDGQAYFERAGAYRRSGDMPKALEDAAKACELGVQPACAVAGRR